MSERTERIKEELRKRKEEEDKQINQIRDWNYERLKEVFDDAGYRITKKTLNRFVEAGVSWHKVKGMIEAGCKPALVARILL